MKLAGILFVVCASGSVGFRIAASLRRHCRFLRQLAAALRILEHEIAFCATPLPQAFALAAASSEGVTARIFSCAAREMDRRRWLSPREAIRMGTEPEALDSAVSDTLLTLGAGLGNYDRDSQVQALQAAGHRLDELLQSAEQERRLKSKTYETLGICAGLAAAILLI